jgi:UDP:flavonoid glycosyltransferase YjiC (YdhE family)
LARLAEALAANGHTPSLAVQRPDAFRPWRQATSNLEIRQAPIWPGLFRHSDIPMLRGEAAWGDLLAGVGMTDSGVLEYLVRCWEQLLVDAQADIVVADFAPSVMLAARGRLPVIAVGTGFTVPPHRTERFTLLRPGVARSLIAEEQLLQVVNRALSRLGREPLQRLTEIARADVSCPATFSELDPYRDDRTSPCLPPFLSGDPGVAGAGDELFAYVAVTDGRTRALSEALGLLATRGYTVSAWLPGLLAPEAEALMQSGVHLHRGPVPPAQIAARARLLVCSGGMGTSSAALAAGLPLAIMPLDLEKQLTANAVAALGVGSLLRVAPEGVAAAASLAGQLLEAVSDPQILVRAQELAPGFRSRLGDPAKLVAEQLERM